MGELFSIVFYLPVLEGHTNSDQWVLIGTEVSAYVRKSGINTQYALLRS